MKKVLFVLHYPPPVHGAAVVGSYVMNSALINRKLKCRYVNLSSSKSLEEIGGNVVGKIIPLFRICISVFREVLSFRPELCYLTLNSKGMGFYKDCIVVFLIKILGVPIIYHFHNKGIESRQDYFIDNLLYRIVFNKSEVILLSDYLYQDLKKYVEKKDVHICHNGIERLPESYEVKTKSELPRILFLSNLIIDKGILELLDACQMLVQRKVQFECTIAGGEAELNANELLNEIDCRGLKTMVKYKGKVSGRKKMTLFQESDIFALPTFYHNECFPLVLLEAMQMRLPVVTTTEGGIRDIVAHGENGFIIEGRDTIGLANRLEELILSEELRASMGELGNKIYEEKFKITNFEERLIQILE